MIRRGPFARGFTLLESLVALAIAAIVLHGFYGTLSTGSLLHSRADDQAERLLVASTVLDRVGVDLPLRAGFAENDTDLGHAWELVVSDVPPSDLTGVGLQSGMLLYVSVAVAGADPEAPPIVLRAIRYAETPL